MSDEEKISTQQRTLAAELTHLRRMARLGTAAITKALGVSQSTVSRIESGSRRPSMAEVDNWLAVSGANDATSERIRNLVKAVHAETMRWHELLTDTGSMQGAVGARERAARTLRVWDPDVVPGLLQTEAYMAALLPMVLRPEADLAESIRGRLERQRILYEPSRRFYFITTEHALSRPVGSPEVMAEQRAWVERQANLDGVTVRIVAEPWPVAVTNGFTLYDDVDDGHPYVTYELESGYATRSIPEEVDAYRQAFDRMLNLAE